VGEVQPCFQLTRYGKTGVEYTPRNSDRRHGAGV
jgi:hypothetical protein